MAFQRKKTPAIGVKAPFPGFIEPVLATAIDRLPSGDRWVHEIKFDGYRVQVHLSNGSIKVFTRRGNDWPNASEKSATMRGTSMWARRLLMAIRRPGIGTQRQCAGFFFLSPVL